MGWKLKQPQLHSEFKDGQDSMRPLQKKKNHKPWHLPWSRHHPNGTLTMYSMLEAGGYT